MIKHIRNETYDNNKGNWNIDINYEDSPTGEDSDTYVFYYKIKGPVPETFRYKLLFGGRGVPTKPFNEILEGMITIGLKKTQALIDRGQYWDTLQTYISRGWK